MVFKFFKSKTVEAVSEAAKTPELWTEVSTEQQETMKGGYPWPGFPPLGGGGFCATTDGNISSRSTSSSSS